MTSIGYYHSQRAPWRGDAGRDFSRLHLDEYLVGVEFEHESDEYDDRARFVDKVAELNEDRALGDRALIEHDSSLSGDRGVEIVLPPLSPAKALNRRGLFAKIVEAARASVGEGASFIPRNDVGMHINLNVAGRSVAVVAACTNTFHHMKNVTKKISGRDTMYAKYILKRAYVSPVIGRFAAHKREYADVIEVRAPQSTVVWEVAQTRVRYCLSVLEFAEQKYDSIFELMGQYIEANASILDSVAYGRHPDAQNEALVSAYKSWLSAQRGKTIGLVKAAVL